MQLSQFRSHETAFAARCDGRTYGGSLPVEPSAAVTAGLAGEIEQTGKSRYQKCQKHLGEPFAPTTVISPEPALRNTRNCSYHQEDCRVRAGRTCGDKRRLLGTWQPARFLPP
jgi:hypothetical protein